MATEEAVRKWNIAGVVLLVIAVIGIIFWRAQPTPVTTDKAFTPGTIPYDIANEQLQYAWLFINWTATDWVLTLLAAGTAIGAAVKNAFSAHNQAQANADAAKAAAAGGDTEGGAKLAVPADNGIDKWVMVLAALTIIATTLESKMHPDVQADRYRRGDLKLQDALIDYKVTKDQVPLVAEWHKAQRILEGLPETPEAAPPASPKVGAEGTTGATSGTVSTASKLPETQKAVEKLPPDHK